MSQVIQNLSNILFIDVETVSEFKSYNDVPEKFKPFWTKKALSQKEFDGSNEDELYAKRAAIFSEFGKIIVISIGQLFYDKENELCLKVKSFSGHSEKELLEEFKRIIEKYDQKLMFCGHNIKEFDLPYIGRRMLVNAIELPSQLDLVGKKPWEIIHIDTMEMWKFGDYKNYTSLDLLASILGLPSSKTDMDGSEVGMYYYEKDGLNEIAEYCNRDVITTAHLYLRLKYPSSKFEIKIVE